MKWVIIAIVLVAIAALVYKFLPDIYAMRGNIAYGKSETDKALKLYQKACRTNRAGAGVKAKYAILVLRDKRPDEAERLFNEIILDKAIPEKQKAMVRQYRCMAYIKQGRIDEAYEETTELLESYKTSDLYAIAGYVMILAKKPAEDILNLCSEAYEYNDENRDIADNYALALIMSGEYARAVEICDMVIEKHERFPEGHYHKALALCKMGDFDQAADELDALDDCEFKYLTTVGDTEIEQLRNEIACKNGKELSENA